MTDRELLRLVGALLAIGDELRRREVEGDSDEACIDAGAHAVIGYRAGVRDAAELLASVIRRCDDGTIVVTLPGEARQIPITVRLV